MIEDVIKLWKINFIKRVVMNYDCGGDSFGDHEFTFFNEKDIEIDSIQCIEDYLYDQVFNEVDFSENSDGYYLGEYGVVNITFNKENQFEFDKVATYEYSESFSAEESVLLSDEEINFVTSKVLNILGNFENCTVNYKTDCILTDKDILIRDTLLDKLQNFAENYEFDVQDDVQDDGADFFSFTTNDIEIKNNTVLITINRNFRVLKDE